jgi:hypothetical protein
VRPTVRDGVWEVWFGRQCLGEIDQRMDAENRRVVRRPPGESDAPPSGGGVGGEGAARRAVIPDDPIPPASVPGSM